MRGVRALWKAPLVAAIALLSSCHLELNLIEPSIEIDAQMAYQSGNKFILDYKFVADESALRCEYTVNYSNAPIKHDVTGAFLPNTWQHLEISLDDAIPPKGEYNLTLMAQAQRGDGFVDLAFLTKTYDFYFDYDAPDAPSFSPIGSLFNDAVEIEFLHPEWDNPDGSPVHIYYTMGRSGDPIPDPSESSPQYIAGTPIAIELSEIPMEIKAIAIDESQRASGIVSETYDFLNITSMQEDFINTLLLEHFIHPQGFGLAGIISASLMDSNGTIVRAEVMGSSNTATTVAVYISNMLSAGSDGVFQGNGTTTDGLLRLFDASGISDDIEINLIPEPPQP